jgi:hypothetical protein
MKINKNTLPSLSLVIFLSLAMASCGNKREEKKRIAFQHFEERYPGWTNLTWVSTDKDSSAFPRMEISIRENVVTVRQLISDTVSVSQEYNMMFFLGNIVTFEDKNKGRLTAFYNQTDSTIMLRTKGLVDEYPGNNHTYLLKKN